MTRIPVLTSLLLLALAVPARADVDLTLRAGAGSLDLAASSDTPLIGGAFDDAITAYNGAAMAYNQAHRLPARSPSAAPTRSHADVGMDATLVTLTPSLDVAASYYRARIDLPIGFGDGVRTIGLGVYPLGAAFAGERASVVPFVLGGAATSYVSDGTRSGALLEARVAGGLRLGRRLSIEIGYRPYAAGGTIDRERIDTLMESYDPRGSAPPPEPSEVVRGGTGSGTVDLAVGLSL